MGVFLDVGYREEHDPSESRLSDVLEHMEDHEGAEGFGVSLTCSQTEWSVYTEKTGLARWLNLSYTSHGNGAPRHMRQVSREKVLALWKLLAAGKIEDIEREPWQPGPGKP